jgi:hypothetical protein
MGIDSVKMRHLDSSIHCQGSLSSLEGYAGTWSLLCNLDCLRYRSTHLYRVDRCLEMKRRNSKEPKTFTSQGPVMSTLSFRTQCSDERTHWKQIWSSLAMHHLHWEQSCSHLPYLITIFIPLGSFLFPSQIILQVCWRLIHNQIEEGLPPIVWRFLYALHLSHSQV